MKARSDLVVRALGGCAEWHAFDQRRCIEDIFLLADGYLGGNLCQLEMIVAGFQHAPEIKVLAITVLGHVFRRHLERVSLNLERALPALEAVAGEGIDILNLLIGHRVTPAGRAGAMNHEMRTGAPMCPVVVVRVTQVEGQMIVGVRVHQTRSDFIESLGRLTIPLLELRAKFARPFADLEFFEQGKAAVALFLPDLKRVLLLEDPYEDRGGCTHVEVGHLPLDVTGDRALGLRAIAKFVCLAACKKSGDKQCATKFAKAEGFRAPCGHETVPDYRSFRSG